MSFCAVAFVVVNAFAVDEWKLERPGSLGLIDATSSRMRLGEFDDHTSAK